ncbi:PA2169 family four-helix-bundle protein [Rhodospirillaceae bacterium SYSU D60014]|uniref:PA2169 family four-helix-bundle protein n=1 Tax=Virgifigura deserti TaxID=2268457 RepID=UPI0013C4164C
MLRDERQIALNDVIVACKDAADGYDDAADASGEPELAALFRTYGRRRREVAAELETHIRDLGDLPRNPDADAETIERLFTQLKAILSADERATLLEERERGEVEIGRLVEAALNTDLPEGTKTALRQLGQEASEAAQCLAAARAPQNT